MEETLVYSVVDKGEGLPQEKLEEKLTKMAGVTHVDASPKEGRVLVSGVGINPTVFSQAIEQSGYEVHFVRG